MIFSFETLTTKGHPQYRSYYANVVKAEKTGEREVTFTFDGAVNRELPLIMGQLPVLPKHYYGDRRLREDVAQAADRQRPLQDQILRARPLDRL